MTSRDGCCTTIHGHRANNRRTGAYNSWRAMKGRCGRRPGYEHIAYDPRWATFEAFYSDMGDRPANHDLGRVDHTQPYFPDNCAWEPRAQNRNWKRST